MGAHHDFEARKGASRAAQWKADEEKKIDLHDLVTSPMKRKKTAVVDSEKECKDNVTPVKKRAI